MHRTHRCAWLIVVVHLAAAAGLGGCAPNLRATPDGLAYVTTVSDAAAEGAVADGFSGMKSKKGFVPNIHRLHGMSPVVYDHFRATHATNANAAAWRLPARDRQLIGLAVSRANGCLM